MRVALTLTQRQPFGTILWHPVTVGLTLVGQLAGIVDHVIGRAPRWRGRVVDDRRRVRRRADEPDVGVDRRAAGHGPDGHGAGRAWPGCQAGHRYPAIGDHGRPIDDGRERGTRPWTHPVEVAACSDDVAAIRGGDSRAPARSAPDGECRWRASFAVAMAIVACGLVTAVWLRELAPLAHQLGLG